MPVRIDMDKLAMIKAALPQSPRTPCSLFATGQECVDCHETIEGRPVYAERAPGLGLLGPMCQGCKLKRAGRW